MPEPSEKDRERARVILRWLAHHDFFVDGVSLRLPTERIAAALAEVRAEGAASMRGRAALRAKQEYEHCFCEEDDYPCGGCKTAAAIEGGIRALPLEEGTDD